MSPPSVLADEQVWAKVDMMRRLEQSLEHLEGLQKRFRHTRSAVAVSPVAAPPETEEGASASVQGPLEAAECQRILEACDALEALMQRWQRSRDQAASELTPTR